MSYELDRNRVMKFLIDNLPPHAVEALREKDYWRRSMEVMKGGLRNPAPKADICPLCQKRNHDV